MPSHTLFENNPENFEGGKISNFLDQWKGITTDSWILRTVRGHEIETSFPPAQTFVPRPIEFTDEDTFLIDSEINNMLRRNVIEPVDPCDYHPHEFISNIFYRTKKQGAIRIILNLRTFNKSVDYHHFKMETLRNALTLIKPGAWFGSIDLKEAFHSVKISPPHRCYLRFFWKGKKYQYTCMPNGLASAPRVWTKLLKPVFSHLRKIGFANVAYIDDSFLQGDSYHDCSQNIDTTAHLLDSLGLTIHPSKSVLVPTQEITFLGFVLNSVLMTVRLTEEKANSLVHCCIMLLRKSKVTIRELAQAIGKMVACEPAVTYAPLYYKALEIEKNQCLKLNKGNFDADITLSPESKPMIEWWTENAPKCSRSILQNKPDIILYTDSSTTGWGGINQTTGNEINGHWDTVEQRFHINYLELKAAFLTLRCLCSEVSHCHIRLNLDSTVAISYINKMGGRKTVLNSLARDMWLWCIDRSIWLSAAHVPGVLNKEADQLSRVHNIDMEWSIVHRVFNKFKSLYGYIDIDLFASAINHKLPIYVSYTPESNAYAVDAFSIDWVQFSLCYAFPPFSVLGQCMQKIVREHAEVVLVAPLWTTQPWFPVLLTLIVDQCYVLPRTDDLLYLPNQPSKRHPLGKMRMGLFRLSGNTSRTMEYRKTLSKSSQLHGEIQLNPSIGVISTSGCSFALNGQLIHLRHL